MKIIMRFSTLLSFAILAIVARAAEPSSPPDIFNVQVKNLAPEDCALDIERNQWYQSNLYRAKINVASQDPAIGSFDVSIPGISSEDLSSPYQLAGVSLNKRHNPTRLYAVAKDHKAFVFNGENRSISPNGPSSFIAFDLPLRKDSRPIWIVDLNPVQEAFQKKFGTRPFGPVDSTQDEDGNSYVVFALGMPAIAKISSDGKTVEAWAGERPLSIKQPRVGYTGIVHEANGNKLIAFGGPRVLTTFNLNSQDPSKPIPVGIKGDVSTNHAEKINLVPSLDNTGSRLLATSSPNVYSFHSPDGSWESGVTFKKFTDTNRFNDAFGLTVVCEAHFKTNGGGQRGRQIYAQGAHFPSGANSGRVKWPMVRLPNYLLRA